MHNGYMNVVKNTRARGSEKWCKAILFGKTKIGRTDQPPITNRDEFFTKNVFLVIHYLHTLPSTVTFRTHSITGSINSLLAPHWDKQEEIEMIGPDHRKPLQMSTGNKCLTRDTGEKHTLIQGKKRYLETFGSQTCKCRPGVILVSREGTR